MMRLAHWSLRARTDRSAAVVMCGATEFKIYCYSFMFEECVVVGKSS